MTLRSVEVDFVLRLCRMLSTRGMAVDCFERVDGSTPLSAIAIHASHPYGHTASIVVEVLYHGVADKYGKRGSKRPVTVGDVGSELSVGIRRSSP